MFPAYIDYTAPETLNAIYKYGFTKFSEYDLKMRGIPVPKITEKTAGEVVNSCLTTHLLTKKYLQNTIENIKDILG